MFCMCVCVCVCNEYCIKLVQLLLLLLLTVYTMYSYIHTHIQYMCDLSEHFPHLFVPSGLLFTSTIIIMIVFACSFLINLIDLFMGCQWIFGISSFPRCNSNTSRHCTHTHFFFRFCNGRYILLAIKAHECMCFCVQIEEATEKAKFAFLYYFTVFPLHSQQWCECE